MQRYEEFMNYPNIIWFFVGISKISALLASNLIAYQFAYHHIYCEGTQKRYFCTQNNDFILYECVSAFHVSCFKLDFKSGILVLGMLGKSVLSKEKSIN